MKHLVRLDWAIKHLLRDKASFDVLEGFLSELLHFDVHIVEILESESNQNRDDDKFNRVDLLVKDDQESLMLIEVQNERELDYFHRILYGTSKLVVDHLALGDAYSKIRKIYSVSIVYFDLGKGEDYVYHGTTRFIGVHKHDILKLNAKQRKAYQVETPADLYPELFLIKIPRFDDQIRNGLDEWVYFLKHDEIPEDFKAKGLQAAREKLQVMKMGTEARGQYQRFLENLRYQTSMVESNYTEGWIDGEDEGLRRGRQEGHREGHREALDALLKEGLITQDVFDSKLAALTAAPGSDDGPK